MTDYKLTVQIDQKWIADFNNSKMRLCFSTGVDNEFNVVAFTSLVAATVEITWTERYQIAATQHSFSNGETFVASTTPETIQYGQTYILPADWTDKRANNDPSAPKDGFRFHNLVTASAIVYKLIGGRPTPVYISPYPLPPGHDDLTPKPIAKVWFSKRSKQGSMISNYGSDAFEVDMSGASPKATIAYDSNGAWTNV